MQTEWVTFGDVEVELPLEMLEGQPTMGLCDDHVAKWYRKIDWSNIAITDDQIREVLKEYGAWDDNELADIKNNRKRLLWICAGNWQEEQE